MPGIVKIYDHGPNAKVGAATLLSRQFFTSAGTFAPSVVRGTGRIVARAVGGGGGARDPDVPNATGNAGGGGGALASWERKTSGGTLSVVVGTGGAAGADGTASTLTVNGNLVLSAAPGKGGDYNPSQGGTGLGGAGGLASDCVGDYAYSGGAGGSYSSGAGSAGSNNPGSNGPTLGLSYGGGGGGGPAGDLAPRVSILPPGQGGGRNGSGYTPPVIGGGSAGGTVLGNPSPPAPGGANGGVVLEFWDA